MKATTPPRPHHAAHATLRQRVVRLLDLIFGPPRPHERPDGGVAVRLLGRRFEASTPGALFDAVAREREKLIEQVARMHEGAAGRAIVPANRLADTYHFQTRRIEDRISLYTAFLGRMARDLDAD